jgi:uncharacterized protein (TIGR02231 family)
MAFFVSLLSLLLFAATAPASSADAPVVEAPLVAVELYPAGARLTRRAEVELGAGSARVELRGLPAKLDAGAIEVLVEPPHAAAVSAVDLRQQMFAGPAHARERELLAEIEALERERDLRRDRIEAGQLQLRMLRRLAQLSGAQAGNGLLAGEPRPDVWRRGWETLGTGALEILTNIRDNEYEAREIERRIEAKRRELDEVATGARAEGVLGVELEVGRPGPIALVLRYDHPEAGFRPVYEAHLATREGTVALRRRAVVWQRTGEDWSGVELVLASVRSTGPTKPPQPEPWFVDVHELRALPRGIAKEGAAPPAPSETAPALAAAVVDATPFAVRYRLPEPVDLPADGRERVFGLASGRHEAELVVTSYPAADPDAFLLARFVYDLGEPLLPGELRLFRDGVAAGLDHLPATVPGAELRLGFGRDEAVAVERRLDTGFRSEEGIFETYRRVERHYVTRIRNGHDRPVEIELLDRIPVPQDERIRVELTRETTPPDERDVGGRRGVLAWRATFAPGEEREIRLGFAVIFPRELEVDGFGGG